MTRNLAKFRPLAVALVQDAAGIGGAALVSYGAGEIYRPAGLILAGGFMLAAAFLGARIKP